MDFDYDLIVIGAGSGGVRAARMAATYGARVAIVEEFRVGGTCVIRGCVPKKLYVYAARFRDQFDIAQSFGWQVDANANAKPRLLLAMYRQQCIEFGVGRPAMIGESPGQDGGMPVSRINIDKQRRFHAATAGIMHL